MIPDLYNELRLIGPCTTDQTPLEAWNTVRPPKNGLTFLKLSFWSVLSGVAFARSDKRQKDFANWLFTKRQFAESKSQPWPPVPIFTKPAFQPTPTP